MLVFRCFFIILVNTVTHFVKCVRMASKAENLKITRIFDLSLFHFCKLSDAFFCLEGGN